MSNSGRVTSRGRGEMLYRLVVMGSSSVGKSALTIQLVKECFVLDCDPTIEDSYQTQMLVDSEACQLDILDTTGNEEHQIQRQKFMRWREGFLCVYAVDDVKSFVDVHIFHNQLHRVKDTDRVPFVLMANKTDLTDGLVTPALGQETAKSFKVPFVEASAKTQKGVEQAFEMLVRRSHVEALKRLPDPEPDQGCGSRRCNIL